MQEIKCMCIFLCISFYCKKEVNTITRNKMILNLLCFFIFLFIDKCVFLFFMKFLFIYVSVFFVFNHYLIRTPPLNNILLFRFFFAHLFSNVVFGGTIISLYIYFGVFFFLYVYHKKT